MRGIAKFFLLASVAALSLSAQAASSAVPCPANTNVGFQIVTFGDLQAAVWYPTNSAETPYNYFTITTTGSVAFNSPPAPCVAPMVVFSHGYGGCAIQSVFITEQLARDGYVV